MQEQAKKIVTKIDANPLLAKRNRENTLLRVAAYCRVSTDSEDQLESYKAQVAYYTDAIAKNPRWRFVDIYADEGITGTNAAKRESFMRMMKDCDKGKIDLILTKSVARFARNTVDSLKYVRKLKAQGIGVYFEEQALDSLKTDSEMFIGLHSVLAQAESENISANVRWGIQQRMKSGTFKFRYNLLGYRKGADGEPEIVPEEAEHIRTIYQMCLDGKSIDQIRKYLEQKHIRTAKGNEKWTLSNIYSILFNERYCGDMLLQKTYTDNCISKKVKKNRGELSKYLIVNNHPAIIDRDTFKLVQMEMSRRGSKRKVSDKSITEQGKYSGKYVLTDLLVCGECGSPYRRRMWVYKGEKRIVWRCLSRVEHGTNFCKRSISVDEEKLQNAICRALDKALENRQEVMDLILSNLAYGVTANDEILDIYAIETQIKQFSLEIEETTRLCASTEGSTERYEKEIKRFSEQIVALRNQLNTVRAKIASNERVNMEIERIKQLLSNKDVSFKTFNDVDVRRLVEYIRVMEHAIIVVLKGGLQIEEALEV